MNSPEGFAHSHVKKNLMQMTFKYNFTLLKQEYFQIQTELLLHTREKVSSITHTHIHTPRRTLSAGVCTHFARVRVNLRVVEGELRSEIALLKLVALQYAIAV